MKKYLFFVPVLLLVALPVSAAQFIHQKDGNYSLPQGETVREDVYVGAKNASIDGSVEGDAHVAGNDVRVEGQVSENLFMAGRLVSLSGAAGHNLYAAGQTIEVSGRVNGDVMGAGDVMTIKQGSVVEGDVFFFGNELRVEGEVKGGVHFFGNMLTFNGGKAASINMHGNTIDLIGASIAGGVTYDASKELSRDQGTTIGGEVKRAPERMHEDRDNPVTDFNFAGFGMGLVMVLLGVWLFGKEIMAFVTDAVARPVRTGVIGLVALVAIPIVSVLVMITIVGLPIGILALLSYAILLVIAKVLGTILIGAVLAKWIKKEYIVNYAWAFIGVIALLLLEMIPFIGWIPGTLAFLVMFGVLILMLEKKFHRGK